MLGPSRTQLDVCHDVCDVIRKEATSRKKKNVIRQWRSNHFHFASPLEQLQEISGLLLVNIYIVNDRRPYTKTHETHQLIPT